MENKNLNYIVLIPSIPVLSSSLHSDQSKVLSSFLSLSECILQYLEFTDSFYFSSFNVIFFLYMMVFFLSGSLSDIGALLWCLSAHLFCILHCSRVLPVPLFCFLLLLKVHVPGLSMECVVEYVFNTVGGSGLSLL